MDVPLSANAYLSYIAWQFERTLFKCHQREAEKQLEEGDELTQDLDEQETAINGNIPSWSAYNSLIGNELLPTTRIGTSPLIAAPAHVWTKLLTVLKQAQCISARVTGPDRKTVISLDMGIYKPAKQLQMFREDMDHIILRPGELHVVMAQLRFIVAYIENSGVEFCWTEADFYGPMTV